MLYSSENKNLTLGAETVKYLREHADDYEDIGSQDPDENLLLAKYLTEIALSTALEGKYVLTAIANITCEPIKVSYQASPRAYYPVRSQQSSHVAINYTINVLF